MPSEPLIQLSADEMRSYGYRIVDILVDHIGALPDKFPTRTADRARLEKRLGGPPPREGVGGGAALDLFEQDVLSSMMHPDHPRYFAFVPGPGNYVSAMADALASGFNIFAVLLQPKLSWLHWIGSFRLVDCLRRLAVPSSVVVQWQI
jgi:hypothetical protein